MSDSSDPMDYSLPGFSVHGIFYQKYWSGVPLPSPVNNPYSATSADVRITNKPLPIGGFANTKSTHKRICYTKEQNC